MKKRNILIIQIIIFTMALLLFTACARKDASQARLVLGTLFLLVGLILKKFREPIAKSMYEKQIESIKKKSSPEKVADGISHGGTLFFSIGIIIILIGLIGLISQ